MHVPQGRGAGQGGPRLRVQDHAVLVHSGDEPGAPGWFCPIRRRRETEADDNDHQAKHRLFFPGRRGCCYVMASEGSGVSQLPLWVRGDNNH